MERKMTTFWLFVLSLCTSFTVIHCASYCYSYYSAYTAYTYYYCFYYYDYYYYYSSYSSVGTIIGAIIGGIVGFIILLTIVVIVCVKVCKTTNHGRVIVQPSQPTVSFVHSANNAYGGPGGYHPAPNPILSPPYHASPQSGPTAPPFYNSLYPPNTQGSQTNSGQSAFSYS